MKSRFLGIFGLILGLLVLSLEGFLLRLIQVIDQLAGSWYPNILRYAMEPIPCISILITVIVVICSICCIYFSYEKAEKKKDEE